MGFFASLIAAVGLDTTDFDKGVRKCELLAKQLSKNVVKDITKIGAGYLTIDYAIRLLGDSFERAGRIKDLSNRLDMDTELLQEFQYAAQKTKTDIEAFSKSIQNINKARGEALGDPNGEKSNLFARYGIGLKELQSMSGEDIFLKIGDAVKGVSNPQNELVFATVLLGETAEKVFPAMREGLDTLAKAAKDAGQVLQKDVVEKLDSVADRYGELKNQAGNLFARGIVGAYDAATWIAGGVMRGMSGASPMAPMNYADMATEKSDKENKKEPQKKKENFTATKAPKTESKSTPTEWAYKAPSGDSLREIGGFTGAAQNAQLAYLEKIKDATERSASANEATASIMKDEGAPIL